MMIFRLLPGDLSKNNERPSSAGIQEATELCAIAQNNLLQIDAEIQRLLEKRAVFQKSVDSYTCTLSPIRRVPADVLREIFYHCLDATRNPIMSATEAPMSLTQVCSFWRSVALTSPKIWAALHIPHPGDLSIPSHYDRHAREDLRQTFSKVMERRCEAVKEWLERSGACLLSLSIFYPRNDNFERYSHNPENDAFLEEIFRIIAPTIQRWRRLDVSMPFSVYQQLQARIPSKAMLSNLQTLRVAVTPRDPRSPLVVLQAPNLRKLSLNASRLTDPKFLPTNTWGLLTELCFDSQVNDVDVVILLGQCPRLVSCRIAQLTHSPARRLLAPACLPHLEKLAIFDHFSPSPAVVCSIKAPSLTFFQYQNTKAPESEWEQSNGDWKRNIAKIMEWFVGNSSSTLQVLKLGPSNFRRDIVLPILQEAVGVKHLHVGWFSPTDILQQEEDEHMKGLFWESIDLSILQVDYFPMFDTGVLLPKLEVLEVNQTCDILDDELLKVFKSRIDAFKRGDASPLKRVKLRLSRRETNDIAETVMEYARSGGIDMKFEVSYCPAPPRPPHLSPSFLLPTPWDAHQC